MPSRRFFRPRVGFRAGLKPLVTSPLIEVGEFTNHRMDGPSTFPFPIMGGAWAERMDLLAGLPGRGETVVGNDVWLGYPTSGANGIGSSAARIRT